jgi:bacterioferritin-associated ferredoxin
MYVCVCNAVTEDDIHDAARDGARRLRDLRACLGVTADCGRCACHAKACLDSAIEQQQPRHNAFSPTFQESAA